MSDKAILFTADQILTPTLEKMYEKDPISFDFINLGKGIFWHPFLGFRGQATIHCARLADLVKSCSLRAEGKELLAHVASEYDALPDISGSFAIGEASFVRPTATIAGDIPKGTILSRAANLAAAIPLVASQYETLVPVHFNVGQLTAGPVPIQAKTTGSNPNHLVLTSTVPHGVTIANALFDKLISVSTFSAGGGAEAADDAFVRKYALAFSIGQYGPTTDASRYAVLRATGVRNLLAYDIPGTGTQKIIVADKKWGSSARWAKFVQQSVYDAGLVGHGCKVIVDQIRNTVITFEATIVLRDRNDTADTTDVDLAVREAVRAYFDDRVDWNVWKSNALKAAITRAHEKVLHCSTVTVKDSDGSTLSETGSVDYASEQKHFYLANGAATITYTGPT